MSVRILRTTEASMLGCLLLMAPVACSRQSEAEGKQSEPTRAQEEDARLELPPEHDFGPVVQFDEVGLKVPLKNAGTGSLLFPEVTQGHSCTAVVPAPIGPGASAVLEVICRPTTYGAFADRLELTTNGAQSPSSIVLTAEVTAALRFERELLDLTLLHGQEKTELLRVVGARSKTARLKGPASTPWREHGLTLGVVDDGSVQVHFVARRAGVFTGSLAVETGLDEPSVISVPYTFAVQGTLSVQPDTIYANLRDPNHPEIQVDIRSSSPGFALTQMRVLEGPFAARSERVGQGHYCAFVRVLVDQIAMGTTGSVGRLLIQTSDPSEPEKIIPIMAMGKVR